MHSKLTGCCLSNAAKPAFSRVQRGFTIIELMMSLVIVAILASIAVPIYQDYTVRARVAEAFSVVSALKLGVEDSYISNNQFEDEDPCDDFSDDCTQLFGVSVVTDNISEVQVGTNGQIKVKFDTNQIPALSGEGEDSDENELLFVPMIMQDGDGYNDSSEASGVIRWKCVSSGTTSIVVTIAQIGGTSSNVSLANGVDGRYVPSECKG